MMASDALRVIACAQRSLEPSDRGGDARIGEAAIEHDLEFLGLVAMRIRRGPKRVKPCARAAAGIRTA